MVVILTPIVLMVVGIPGFSRAFAISFTEDIPFFSTKVHLEAPSSPGTSQDSSWCFEKPPRCFKPAVFQTWGPVFLNLFL